MLDESLTTHSIHERNEHLSCLTFSLITCEISLFSFSSKYTEIDEGISIPHERRKNEVQHVFKKNRNILTPEHHHHHHQNGIVCYFERALLFTAYVQQRRQTADCRMCKPYTVYRALEATASVSCRCAFP